MLKHYTIPEWFGLFAKEWIFPTFGKAFGIATITAAIFTLPKETQLPNELTRNIENFFGLTNSGFFQILLLCSVIGLIVTWLAKHLGRGKHNAWNVVAKKRGPLALLASLLFGVILLPLVVGIVALTSNGTPALAFVLLPMAMTYIFLSGAFHWMGVTDMAPAAGLTYIVRPATGDVRFDFREKTAARFAALMAYCPHAEATAVLAETNDGSLTLFVPVNQDPSRIPADGRETWNCFTRALENEWTENDIAFTRMPSPALTFLGNADA
ncbi:MAG: hypothetical protein V4633_06385 [Pseudomonadota bacterium]